MDIVVIIKLWVFNTEDEEIMWMAENWQGSNPDDGKFDPLLLMRGDGESAGAYQLFKLECIAEVNGEKSAIYHRVPVAREGWFYEALPKWGFKQMEEPGFIMNTLSNGLIN